jgi:predicted MFS family arabinose efflux permease
MSRYQWYVVSLLAFLQFTIVLDFMVLSPLGPFLIPSLQISNSQFGNVVSAYAFAAGLSGILAAGIADRFDRKKFLLTFYSGFLIATLLCGLAQTFEMLLFARILTGLFSGVLGAAIFAVAADVFSLESRGRVMGVIQTAFALSQVLGLPLSLYLSNMWNWHAPFLMIAFLGFLVGIVIVKVVKPVNGHLEAGRKLKPTAHLISTVTNTRYLKGFATTALLSTGGFMLMPFASVFSVHNLGINTESLPALYMVTGICAMIAGPLVGRLSDSVGSFTMFFVGTLMTISMILVYTNLGPTSLGTLMIINSLLFIGITSRIVPSQAIISTVPLPKDRGSYMSVSSSVQQLSGGIASVLAGLIVTIDSEGKVQHFPTLGYVVVGASVITLVMMSRLRDSQGATPSALSPKS